MLLGLPVAVLMTAYAAICVHFRSAWPFAMAVHEDGRHTLLGTILYFEHAVGELPVELLLSTATAGAMLRCAGHPAAAAGRAWRLAGAALGLDMLILLGSIISQGPQTTLAWFLQYHTRDGSPLEFGSHWRYHWLSEACLMLFAMALAGVVGRGSGSGRLLRASWIGFGVASVLFGLNDAPFIDARYLGHQARETLTHAVTTVPMALGVCGLFTNGMRGGNSRCAIIWPAAVCVLLAAYQAAGAVSGGMRAHAQSTDAVRLLCTHFFEHSFSYLVVASHAALLYVLAGARGGRS